MVGFDTQNARNLRGRLEGLDGLDGDLGLAIFVSKKWGPLHWIERAALVLSAKSVSQ